MSQSLSIALLVLVLANVSAPARADEYSKKEPAKAENEPTRTENATVAELIAEIKATVKKRKYKWDLSVFSDEGFTVQSYSVNKNPLVYYTCGDRDSGNTSLIISGVHGDEVNPLYFGFRLVEWLRARPELCKGGFVVIAPLVNPDGALRYTTGTRTNFNKIDVNRNFDTPDFAPLAMKMWREKFRSRRYYPGEKGGSEPETQFQKWLIDEFKPAKIMSIHAPLNVLDYDGPSTAAAGTDDFTKSYIDSCESLKAAMKKATPSLNFFAYGIFPGSLGNYAGKQRGIPTFTVELPTTDPSSAGHFFSELEAGTRLFITQTVMQKQAKNSSSQDSNN
ncbi:MAG: M14 family zinc carboxypeptidase [Bdellovibrionia bacterium]